jgi:hypothetical protein
MKPEDFEFILERVHAFGKRLQNRYGEKVEIGWRDKWGESLTECYEAERFRIKRDMNIANSERMDRHKIAAALTISIMKTEPLTTRGGAQLAAVLHSNTQLAINTSIELLLLFLDCELEVMKYSCSPEQNFEWSPTREGHYALHFAKELRHLFDQKGYGIYMLPNVYFLLEAFHREKSGIPSAPLDKKVVPIKSAHLQRLG